MRHFDENLEELKAKLLNMAGCVESAIVHALDALLERNAMKLNKVYKLEEEINLDHKEVDDRAVKLIALQQPLAVDLRLIVAIIKINTDLERMGDQAVNIAQNAEKYLQVKPLKPLVDLPKMAQEVRTMVRLCLDSFVNGSERIARDVLSRDDLVDALKQKIFKDVLEILKKNPEDIESGLDLILIARNLERIGDHATNIAEDVIFAFTGEDVRHSPKRDALKDSIK